MPGVIYAAAPIESLYYPAAQVREDSFGDFYAPAPHRAGITYSVVSHLPDYTPASLRVLNQDTPAPVDGTDLDLGNLSPRAAALARTYLDGYDPVTQRYDAVIALAKHLQADYRHTPPPPNGRATGRDKGEAGGGVGKGVGGWRRSKVVGSSTATCLPWSETANAARSATSVLPKPTSPQISRSIGRPELRSLIVVSMAASWSSVSS